MRSRALRGFALLIVVTLLAFVVILLVGLAAYTRVETSVAGNTQRQAQARENALLGLNVALGQLQKYAGPDTRVTATAEAFPNRSGTTHYTGVWDSTATGPQPLTWLVSGNEVPDADGNAQPLAVIPNTAVNTTTGIALVSTNTSRTTNDVLARLMPITATGVPGAPTTGTVPPIGRYAYWVGDQGVKAPVALPDNTSSITYAPYDSAELRSRIRQQISLGAGAADANGNPSFEPRDTTGTTANPSNATLAGNVTATSQIAFFKNPSSTGAAIGLTGTNGVQANYHAWSPNNFNVLASTSQRSAGLRRDLSLDPAMLGVNFATWANYDPANGGYMEDPAAPADPKPLPDFTIDAVRRRYKITPGVFTPTVGIAPVLSYLYLLVGVKKTTGSPYTVSLRWAAALWNPYSSALVPQDLRLEISGLPTDVTPTVVDPVTNTTTDDLPLNLAQIYGDPFKVTLPWSPSSTPTPEEESWLPGRIYNWTDVPNSPLQSGDNPGRFNSRDLTDGFLSGLTATAPGSPTVLSSSQLALHVGLETKLTVKLTQADGTVLATYRSPTYDPVPITAASDASGNTSQLGFLFRLAESVDTPAAPELWLTSAGRDPRSDDLPSDSFLALPNGTNPAAYRDFITIRAPERLLDRDVTKGTSYNEDVPLFELPRAPILSVGELQHFYLAGARPFAIGNSWGSGARLNGINVDELFDRFYFSGLVPGVAPTVANGSLLLPNPRLKVMPRDSATGAPIAVTDLQQAPGAHSSKFLLQSGAFNLNSVSPSAWTAVLRGVRFSAPASFKYLDADAATGTNGDASLQSVQSTAAQFFRFAQSAQEVFKADDGYIQSTPGSEEDVINTPLYRRGMRTLTAAEVRALAIAITNALKAHHATDGPFRTLEEFLKPSAAGSPSLLEQAIADAGINSSIAEFSSQFLTQADIMTALAPALFPRSDTFVIRAYGEALNPTTSTTAAPVVEGRAWCEAIVQRVPDYFDPSDPAETAPADFDTPVDPADPNSQPSAAHQLNKQLGRRFKVVSFRWLTRSDI